MAGHKIHVSQIIFQNGTCCFIRLCALLGFGATENELFSYNPFSSYLNTNNIFPSSLKFTMSSIGSLKNVFNYIKKENFKQVKGTLG